jgi:hypothetical protein
MMFPDRRLNKPERRRRKSMALGIVEKLTEYRVVGPE